MTCITNMTHMTCITTMTYITDIKDNFLKQCTYAYFFAISQKQWPYLYCVLFSKFM